MTTTPVQSIPGPDLEFWLDGSTTLRKNLRRQDVQSDCAALTTAVMTSAAIYLEKGDVVTNLTFVSSSTAAAGPTHWFFALYSTASTPALLAQTADQTSTAWAADTAKTVALTSPYTVTTTGIHYAGICVVDGSAVPTLAGITLDSTVPSAAIISGQKVLAQTSGSGLTDTAPSTITSATTVATVPLVIVS